MHFHPTTFSGKLCCSSHTWCVSCSLQVSPQQFLTHMVKNDDLSPQDARQEDTEHNNAITEDNKNDMAVTAGLDYQVTVFSGKPYNSNS